MTLAPDHVASIRFRAGIGGEPVLQEQQSSTGHSFRVARWGASVVASPAAGGDHYGLAVAVGVGCCAEIRSSGPAVARPGAGGASSLQITATVPSDGMLTWRPEPGIAADGCDHLCQATVELAANARLLWRDEFLLQPDGTGAAGTWRSRLRVVRDGWPVVASDLAVGPGSPLWDSPAVLDGARAVSLMVVVDPGPDPETWVPARAGEGSATGVALPLAGPGVHLLAWGDDLFDCRAAMERMVPRCGMPEWAAERWREGRALDTVG